MQQFQRARSWAGILVVAALVQVAAEARLHKIIVIILPACGNGLEVIDCQFAA